MKGRRVFVAGLSGFALALAALTCVAAELLTGLVELDDGSVRTFSLAAESRESVVGGEIRFGDRTFRVTGQSRLGLIGAERMLEAGSPSSEFAVFSSSFSEQTAVGQPWVKAERYLNCDQRYNSFLAIYGVEDAAAVAELGKTPYPVLVDDPGKSDHSEVFCFVSRPPA